MVSEDTSADYSPHFSDPDRMVMWQLIEQVAVRSSAPLTCPICLDEPSAPKMTKCGHIYCWPCILHYLALGENAWRKCPICFESIYKADLKSVCAERVTECKCGDEIELTLMLKQKMSTLYFPIAAQDTINRLKPTELAHFRQPEFADCVRYLKMHVAGADYVREAIVTREKDALMTLLRHGSDQHSAPFIQEALNLVEEREYALSKPVEISAQKSADESKLVSGVQMMNLENVVSYKDAFEAEEDAKIEKIEAVSTTFTVNEANVGGSDEGTCCSSIEAEHVEEESEELMEGVVEVNDDMFHYFYQAADGQRIYLASLNFRCLMSEFKTIVKCPTKIRAKIVAIENHFMSEELRRRYKYLAHLPLHSEFQIVELELKEPFLSKETLKVYEKEIEAKKQARAKKEAFESRRLKKMMSAIDEKKFYTNYSALDERSINRMPRVESVIDYSAEFPNFEEAKAAQPSRQSSGEVPDAAAAAQQHPLGHSCSYSQMVRVDNKVNDSMWPKVSPNGGARQEASVAWTAPSWGPKQASAATQAGARVKTSSISNDETEESEAIRAPGYKESFFDAIDMALKNAKKGTKDADHADEQQTPTKQQDKKKKKKSALLLFST